MKKDDNSFLFSRQNASLYPSVLTSILALTLLGAVSPMLLHAQEPTLVQKFESAEAIAAQKGTVGADVEFVDGKFGRGAIISGPKAISYPTKGILNPNRGAVEMWVKPNWQPDDGKRHTFFHMSNAHGDHFTLFKTESTRLRAVHRGSRARWRAAEQDVSDWKPGEWHHLIVNWLTDKGGAIIITLSVDGKLSLAGGGKEISPMPERLHFGVRGSIDPADAVIDEVRIFPTEVFSAIKTSPSEIDVKVKAGKATGKLPRVHDFTTPWNSKTNRIPFRIGDAYFRRFKEAGFKMARLVAFSSGWLYGVGVSRNAAGKVEIDFSDFDKLLDLYMAAGAEPYIRLAYHLPKELSSSSSRDFMDWGYSAPADYAEWEDFIYRIVKHCNVDRKLGIKYWVAFLNEADISVSRGKADWNEMCKLYESTVRAARAADPNIKVGGPAIIARSLHLLRSFLKYCRKRKLPVDFICYHAYRQAHPKDYEEITQKVKAVVNEEWPDLNPEYFLDEWNLWQRDKRQNNEYGAAYIAAGLHYQMRAGVTKSSIVSFNSHLPTEKLRTQIFSIKGPFHKTDRRLARFYADKMKIDGEEKISFVTHPPGGIENFTFGDFNVALPKDKAISLSFYTGLPLNHPNMDGVGFKVTMKNADESGPLFDVHQRDRPWRHHRIDLSPYMGQAVTLRFSTDAGPSGRATADWACWGEPKLVAKTDDGSPTTLYDFIDHITDATSGFAKPYNWATSSNSLPIIKGNVVTPIYFVFKMFSMLADRQIPVQLDGEGGIHKSDTVGGIGAKDDEKITILLWHFDLPSGDLKQLSGDKKYDCPKTINLTISDVPRSIIKNESVTVKRYVIDETHSNAYYDYVIKKKSDNGGRYNLENGELELMESKTVPVEALSAKLKIEVPNLSVTLIVLTSRDLL